MHEGNPIKIIKRMIFEKLMAKSSQIDERYETMNLRSSMTSNYYELKEMCITHIMNRFSKVNTQKES
jgi:hypothetical protein